MSFEVVLRSGEVFDLAARAEAIQLLDRARLYAITHGRAVEGPNWGVFGDGLEQPSQIRLRLYLDKNLRERWQQRMTIEAIEAAISQASVLRNIADLREYAVQGGHVTQESPTERSYVLELTFWPTVRRAAFLDGFPLGALRLLPNGELEPLPGVTTTPTTTIIEGDGEQFALSALEATHG